MVDAIRVDAGNTDHLISTGLTDFSGWTPVDVEDLQDFGLLHIYPHPDPVDYADDVAYTKAAKPSNAPLIVDETGIFNGGDPWAFIRDSRPEASGWVTHYRDDTPAEHYTPPMAWPVDHVFPLIHASFMGHLSVVRPNSAGVMQP